MNSRTIIIFLILKVISTNCLALTFQELKNNQSDLIEYVTKVLEQHHYHLTNPILSAECNGCNIVVATEQGRKFLKVHKPGNGLLEYNNALHFACYHPVIKPEDLIQTDSIDLVIQPYIEEIDQGHILFDVIYNSSVVPNVIVSMTDSILSIACKTACVAQQRVSNDSFYYDRLCTQERDNCSGRIETFYTNTTACISNLSVKWETLLDVKWIIDGIHYQETLRMLLQHAYDVLNPMNKRIVGICHGDWHDLNIYYNPHNDDFYFIDCEYSGYNDLIADAVIYLANAIHADYITPKYYQELFSKRRVKICNTPPLIQKKREIIAFIYGNIIELRGVGTFGTSTIRKQIVSLFIREYLKPLSRFMQEKFGFSEHIIDEKIKSCILLRLVSVFNIVKLDPMDQAKILGFIMKVLSTPLNDTNVSILQRFEEAL